MKHLNVYVDGGCPVNPGHWMGIGVYCSKFTLSEGFHLENGQLTAEKDLPFKFRGHGFRSYTNNVAEFYALFRATEELNKRGIMQARIFSDSTFTVSIITGVYGTKKPHLRIFVTPIRKGLKRGDHTLDWIPREENWKADELATRAIEREGYVYPGTRGKRRVADEEQRIDQNDEAGRWLASRP